MKNERVSAFSKLITGKVILPGENGYDEARAIWNGMFDKKPSLIVRCLNSRDISQAVMFARENQLRIAVKGGGHNSAGNAVVDEGMMIDLSLMQKVEVDPDRQVVKVEGGACWELWMKPPRNTGWLCPLVLYRIQELED